jgi:capsular polysaccharide biosynthesis protein
VDEVRGSDSIANSELRVVFCPRSSSATRSLKEEEELLTSLREKVSGLGGEVIVFEKASKHDNSTSLSSNESPLEFVLDSVELFRSANVVVGVHGKSRFYS